ncbi:MULTISPECIES: hypothetical protein [unclassified Haloarcula]|uniref:hypothetical protein n=1 Tax=unclassified Haloarcula TaxID=2624677 RepID=UPI0012AC59A4|nr:MULTISPECIES: hypothetical protein [unclassified Haloarcula]
MRTTRDPLQRVSRDSNRSKTVVSLRSPLRLAGFELRARRLLTSVRRTTGVAGLSETEGFARVATAASVFRADARNHEAGVAGFEPDRDSLRSSRRVRISGPFSRLAVARRKTGVAGFEPAF